MNMRIYDYNNRVTEIELPDNKQIKAIVVQILSGDETGFVRFTDGSNIGFDASNCRCICFNDGCYMVDGEDIVKWLNWDPCGFNYSYARYDAFCK